MIEGIGYSFDIIFDWFSGTAFWYLAKKVNDQTNIMYLIIYE